MGEVTVEAGEEPAAMSRGENEGTAARYNELQRLEKEILVYQQLPAVAKDDPAIVGDHYSGQCARCSGSRKA